MSHEEERVNGLECGKNLKGGRNLQVGGGQWCRLRTQIFGLGPGGWHPFRMCLNIHVGGVRWSFAGKKANDHRLLSVNPPGCKLSRHPQSSSGAVPRGALRPSANPFALQSEECYKGHGDLSRTDAAVDLCRMVGFLPGFRPAVASSY